MCHKDFCIVWYCSEQVAPTEFVSVKRHVPKDWLPRESVKMDSIDDRCFSDEICDAETFTDLSRLRCITLEAVVVITCD